MAKKTFGDGRKIRIIIVDDHPVVRQGLALLIKQETDMEVCGEAADIPGALQAVDALDPDLAIVDISLREASGIDLIKDFKIRRPDMVILVMSMHEEAFYAERVLRAGARGYVMKEEATGTVTTAIRKVMDGEIYLSDRMAAKMLSKLVGGQPAAGLPIDRLSDREFQVFELTGRGINTNDIARRLHIAVKTVETYRARIKQKLKLKDASELLQLAITWSRKQ